MKLKGKVWKFGNDVDTDELFAGRFIMGGDETNEELYREFIEESGLSNLQSRENIPEKFAFEVRKGDVIVAGENFGLGSSRQQAAETLKFKGVQAVIADSIHRLFFRNFWNLGCPALDIPGISKQFETGDKIEIDLKKSVVTNLSQEKEFRFHLVAPSWFIDMVRAGGLIPFYKHLKS